MREKEIRGLDYRHRIDWFGEGDPLELGQLVGTKPRGVPNGVCRRWVMACVVELQTGLDIEEVRLRGPLEFE
jgi:hypothetical protein